MANERNERHRDRQGRWYQAGQRVEETALRIAERGPIFGFIKFFFILLFIVSVVGGGLYALGWFGEAANVAREEFGPRAMMQKYNWFKDAAAALDAKRATIRQFEVKMKAMDEDYADIHRKDWDRVDKQQYNQWRTEIDGIKASFNNLAKEYNAAMAKINFQFANVGELPQGADKALPREYAPYMTE